MRKSKNYLNNKIIVVGFVLILFSVFSVALAQYFDSGIPEPRDEIVNLYKDEDGSILAHIEWRSDPDIIGYIVEGSQKGQPSEDLALIELPEQDQFNDGGEIVLKGLEKDREFGLFVTSFDSEGGTSKTKPINFITSEDKCQPLPAGIDFIDPQSEGMEVVPNDSTSE